MKIVCLSDTHNLLDRISVPDGDVLLHAGDFTNKGTIPEIAKFNYDIMKLPHPNKVVIAGNHELLFESDNVLARSLLDPSIHYLEQSSVVIDGIKIWGSPYTPEFCGWAFGYNGMDYQLRPYWDEIPDDADIVITHGPPHMIMDFVKEANNYHKNIGCKELRKAIERVGPRLHLFGHNHGGYGSNKTNNVVYINAACGDKAQNKPIVYNI